MLNKSYILKHWGATLGTAPFLPALYEAFFSSGKDWLEILGSYPLFLLFGFLFSLPSLFGYVLLFQLLLKPALPLLVKKLLLIGFAVLGISITFWLIKGSMAPTLGISYSLAAIITGLLFRLKKHNEALPARVASPNER
jgi:hypothetical protein